MELVLFRHGIAAPRETHQGPDAARELTEQGRVRTRAAARGLAALGVSPQLVLASPLVRARQTGEVLVDVLGVRRGVEIVDELTPGALVGQVLTRLDAVTAGTLICVGHAPDLDLLARALLDGGLVALTELKKAGALCIDCDRPSDRRGQLRWLMPPKTLRLLGKDDED